MKCFLKTILTTIIASTFLTFASFAKSYESIEPQVTNILNMNISDQEKFIYLQALPNTYCVMPGTAFSDIQTVLNTCNDSADNKVNIVVFPGTYNKFSMVKPVNRDRYINIIGVDKDTTIIKDDTGLYETPAAEIRTIGKIANLQFITTHNNININQYANSKGGYAVHSDYGYVNMEFINCSFKSYQAPALGIGLYPDSSIKFDECDIERVITDNFGNMDGLGALYCHTSMISQNYPNQNLVFNNCSVKNTKTTETVIVLQKLNNNIGNFKYLNCNFSKDDITNLGFNISK